MARNQYVIYQCISELKNNKLEAIIKLPSLWSYEKLAIALATLDNETTEIEILNEGIKDSFSINEKTYDGNLEFDELDDPTINVTLITEEKSTTFSCKKIGVDYSNNNITRTTPIVVSCNYNRYAEKDMLRKFNMTKELFMY